MSKRGSNRNRSDISGSLESIKSSLCEGEEVTEEAVEDTENLERLDNVLEYGGTAEGGDALESGIHGTQDVAVGVFEEREGLLESEQEKNREFSGELDERSDLDERDLSKVSETGKGFHATETRGEIQNAERALKEDMEFLGGRISESNDRGRESDQALSALKGRVKRRR